jgi:hypothetical protein
MTIVLIVTKADKGKKIVIINKNTLNQKVQTFVCNNNVKRL